MAFTVKRFKDYIYNELNRESRVRHMNDRAIQFEDAEGRKIKISPDEGVQVEDSAGTIIHDTPDCIIAADMSYGGHAYFKDAPNYIDSISIAGVSEGNFIEAFYSSVNNVSLTASLPTDLTNPSGALVYADAYFVIDDEMTSDYTLGAAEAHYCKTYNSSVNSTYNYMAKTQLAAQSASGDTQNLRLIGGSQCVVPIAYNGTDPNITWWTYFYMSNLSTATGKNYNNVVYLYLQGFLV